MAMVHGKVQPLPLGFLWAVVLILDTKEWFMSRKSRSNVRKLESGSGKGEVSLDSVYVRTRNIKAQRRRGRNRPVKRLTASLPTCLLFNLTLQL